MTPCDGRHGLAEAPTSAIRRVVSRMARMTASVWPSMLMRWEIEHGAGRCQRYDPDVRRHRRPCHCERSEAISRESSHVARGRLHRCASKKQSLLPRPWSASRPKPTREGGVLSRSDRRFIQGRPAAPAGGATRHDIPGSARNNTPRRAAHGELMPDPLLLESRIAVALARHFRPARKLPHRSPAAAGRADGWYCSRIPRRRSA